MVMSHQIWLKVTGSLRRIWMGLLTQGPMVNGRRRIVSMRISFISDNRREADTSLRHLVVIGVLTAVSAVFAACEMLGFHDCPWHQKPTVAVDAPDGRVNDTL
jgi:hypothetical protein